MSRPFLAIAAVIALLLGSAHAVRYNLVQVAPGQLTLLSETQSNLADFNDPSVAVVGEYNSTIMQTGWDVLKVTSNPSFSDEDQAYAAGYFEGLVTANQAYLHFTNHYATNPVPENINAFLEQHITWLEGQIAANNRTDPYWYQAGLMWLQFRGLLDGINQELSEPNFNFTAVKLMGLTAMGDMFDLRAALQSDSRQRMDWRSMKKHDFDRWFAKNTHCSALYKVADDLSDIWFGHTAWYNFNTMLRIFKYMTLNYNNNMTNAKTISYSSYPGMLSSFDDFYVTDSGFNVIETSLEVFNLTMYEGNIRPDLVLYWMRVMIATRTATSAPNWAATVTRLNSGTYNNQWMILDLNLFTPGQALVPNTMWIAEQFPGIVKSRDVTEVLSFGYYPSFNVPMDEELFVWSGYAEAVQTQGPEMNSYQICVRAQIFRRDQATVTDMPSFQHIMRYNDFEQDPISQGNPLYAIASRVDLDPHDPECFGALDAKLSSYSLWKNGMTVLAQSGPTHQQPIFEFNATLSSCGKHVGIPEVMNFGFQTMKP